MLVLASSSKFRKAQLEQIDLSFNSISPNIDEDSFKEQIIDPIELSRRLSLEKAKEVLKSNPYDIIIGSDQVLSLEGKIFNKPGSHENAINQLLELQGKTHELITSFAIISKEREVIDTVISKMKMRKLSKEQIEGYVKKDEPLYSCGSYKLETIGIALFESIESTDHSSIIGLPLISLTTHLKSFGIEVI